MFMGTAWGAHFVHRSHVLGKKSLNIFLFRRWPAVWPAMCSWIEASFCRPAGGGRAVCGGRRAAGGGAAGRRASDGGRRAAYGGRRAEGGGLLLARRKCLEDNLNEEKIQQVACRVRILILRVCASLCFHVSRVGFSQRMHQALFGEVG